MTGHKLLLLNCTMVLQRQNHWVLGSLENKGNNVKVNFRPFPVSNVLRRGKGWEFNAVSNIGRVKHPKSVNISRTLKA